MPDASSYALAEPLTRPRRTPAAMLAWMIDSLDGERRPRRNAEVVLRDVLSKLAVVSGTLPQSGDTLGGRVVEALPGGDTTLRSVSPIDPSTPSDIAGLRALERVCWNHIEMLQRQGKTYGLAQLIDQARKIKVDMLKFKEKETATMVAKVEVEEMMRRVKDALQPHPEALKAVMTALQG